MQGSGPGCLVRILYFILIGWWLAGVWIFVAWLLNLTVVGLPIGLMMINRVPQIMTLSPGSQELVVRQVGNTMVISTSARQYPMWLRILYFIFVGWWASLLWTLVAYLLSLIPFLWPISFPMFNWLPFVTTLRRN
jgi:uncharacterized membrane protein YccF (DUF307 family)